MFVQKIEMPKTPTRENGVVVLITGGFDPLHHGHLDYIDAAKDLGREDSWHGAKVVVGVNSDEWLTERKAKRLCLLKNELDYYLQCVTLIKLLRLMTLMILV